MMIYLTLPPTMFAASGILGRVFARQEKNASQIDQFLAIEMKGFNTGPASRGQANCVKIIVTPGKVFTPLLSARIEQRNPPIGLRINGMRAITFVAIAPTRER